MIVDGVIFFVLHMIVMQSLRSFVQARNESEDENKRETVLTMIFVHFIIAMISVIVAAWYGFSWYFCTFITGQGIMYSLGGRPARMSRRADTVAGGFFLISFIGFVMSLF